jgi:F0F1-type ATP synthase assembly protein I
MCRHENHTWTPVKIIPSPKINTTNATSNDGLGRGMDLVLVTGLFLGFGYLLDRWLDTKPVFMIALVIVAVSGQFVSMRYRYEAAMNDLETKRQEAIQAAPRSQAS